MILPALRQGGSIPLCCGAERSGCQSRASRPAVPAWPTPALACYSCGQDGLTSQSLKVSKEVKNLPFLLFSMNAHPEELPAEGREGRGPVGFASVLTWGAFGSFEIQF